MKSNRIATAFLSFLHNNLGMERINTLITLVHVVQMVKIVQEAL